MNVPVPRGGQLVLDFDGVLCDSAGECLDIIWASSNDFGIEAFAARDGKHAVPAEVAEAYWSTRPYMRHLQHFIVPLLGGPVPEDRAAFAERFASLAPGVADAFAKAARTYREAVRAGRRDDWLARHGVWPQVAELVDGAYIATARDRASVIDILAAHGVQADPARIFDELTEKTATLARIAARESLTPDKVWLLDDSVDNCRAAKAAGFGAGWASWGCSGPGDEATAVAHAIPVIRLEGKTPPWISTRFARHG
jgi:phosphoglycolate phosphatase-like HAD superfamily hydrolase